jgi:hypothetical protein
MDAEKIDNSPSLKRGDSPTYTLRGFRVWSSCFPVATNVSTPQAVTECPSANMKDSSLRYKKQENLRLISPLLKQGALRLCLVILEILQKKSEILSYNMNQCIMR